MRYIDDILYLIGWICLIVCAFSFGWQIGLIVCAAFCWVTAFVWARACVRLAKKSRDEPDRRDML